MKVRLHYNFTDYRPTVELIVHPEVIAQTLNDLLEHVKDGALSSVEIEGDGESYRIKPRQSH